MANIRITVEGPLMDGHKITFKAPCDCSSVEKLDVRYIESNTQKSKLFTMKDSHGNDLTGLGNLFSQGAYVDVVLDPNSSAAYLQNASTNAYLEGKLKTVAAPVDNLTSTSTTLPLSARQGKVLNDGKVDKVSGKGLSTNDYTTTEKNKLAGIASGATKNTVDSSLSTSSTNPVQNKVVASKFNELTKSLTDMFLEEIITINAKDIPSKAYKYFSFTPTIPDGYKVFSRTVESTETAFQCTFIADNDKVTVYNGYTASWSKDIKIIIKYIKDI